jgi:phenylpropionate dioxygenase-like ring-hydroxylating dioxygenase large terminal subunit
MLAGVLCDHEHLMSRFPFPSTFVGWYQIAYSDELAPRAVVPLRYFGKDLVAFRDEDGVARVFDAHCAHLGAHLGYGGRVEGKGLRCPFHGWCFDGEGACVSIPYAEKVPPRARLRAYPTCEVNGMVIAWYHPDGAAPEWEVPALPEHGSPDYHPSVRHRWTIRTHIHELGENIVDGAHFHEVHTAESFPETLVEAHGPSLRTISHMQQRTPRGSIDATIEGTAYGLGLWVLRFSGIVDTVFIDAATPIDDERVEVRFAFMVTRNNDASPTRGVGAALIADVVHQVEQDIPIWENKVFRSEPPLCAGDAAIPAYRRWARQFYAGL